MRPVGAKTLSLSIKSSVTLLLFWFSLVSGASRLVEVGTLPETSNYPTQSIQFLSDKDGYAWNMDALWKTRDGGKTWMPVRLPNSQLGSVHFESFNNGWIDSSDPGKDGNLYRTNDGGQTWIKQPRPPMFELFFLPGGTLGWAGGMWLSDPPPHLTIQPGCIFPPDKRVLKPQIFRTTDGGKHWIEQLLPVLSGCPIMAIYFRSSTQGVAAAGKHVYFTQDGGAHWRSSALSHVCSEPYPDERVQLTTVFFYDRDTGWLGTDRTLLRTVDGGETWCSLKYPMTRGGGLGEFGKLYFDSPSHGWLLSQDMLLYETIDGGNKWRAVDGPADAHVYAISCDPKGCWAVSDNKLYRTITPPTVQ
jgi:photosystem II stability/assembly factor-like uncharacterized protein